MRTDASDCPHLAYGVLNPADERKADHPVAGPQSPAEQSLAAISFRDGPDNKDLGERCQFDYAQHRSYWMQRLQAATALSDQLLEARIRDTASFFSPVLGVPQHFVQMLLIIEDKRFGFHFGIDPVSMVRALVSNLLQCGDLQGASTITQQLYDILKLENDSDYARTRNLRRKLKQVCWSIRRDFSDTKVNILTTYLSRVYWGKSYYGIDAACAGYFRGHRSSISVAESFFLTERLASPNKTYASRIESLLARPAILELMLTDDSSPDDVRRIYEVQIDRRGCS